MDTVSSGNTNATGASVQNGRGRRVPGFATGRPFQRPSRARAAGGWSKLSASARLYLLGIAVVTTGASLPVLSEFSVTRGDLLTFVVLAVSAAVAQWLVVPTGRNHGFPVAMLFVVAAAILLPAEFVVLIGLAQHAPDLVKRRYPWFIQAFNVSNFTLNAL
ncbi:MAG: hypothetical protein M3M94_04320, partial [Actinomycetota bacterium]|nr:hypothetical protein [Actinomycetota bacterium]